MNAGIIMITPGPSVADPCDVVKIGVTQKDGKILYFSTPRRRRRWLRFLIWGIRRYVRSL